MGGGEREGVGVKEKKASKRYTVKRGRWRRLGGGKKRGFGEVWKGHKRMSNYNL